MSLVGTRPPTVDEWAYHEIEDRKYPASIEQYTGDILLVGINYDKKTKKHESVIEQYEK